MASTTTPACRPACGQTLIELIAVMGIMSVVLLLALPRAEPMRPPLVDAAVGAVARALRFAQADALRTGSYRVVDIDASAATVRVYGLNMTPTPPIEDTANPVMHPVDKKRYDLFLRDAYAGAGISISASFAYSDGTTVTQVTFGSDGVPVKLNGPTAADIKPLNATGVIQVAIDTFSRSLNVDVDSGRVTLLKS